MLSAKAAQRCLEVLQASLLKDDADAKKRLLTPIPSTGDELHGPVDKNDGQLVNHTPILGVSSRS